MSFVIYAQQNQAQKVKKVTTQRWQCWHDQLMMCFSVSQWTNMQMLQRYFMFHPIIPCHSLVTYHCGHVITSTIPFTYEREGLLIGEFIHSSAELIVVLWRSRFTSWSSSKFSHFTFPQGNSKQIRTTRRDLNWWCSSILFNIQS